MKIEISNDKSSATIDGVEYTRKGKKISEWLQELPDGYRELALANFKEQKKEDRIVLYMYDAISSFLFFKTKEGGDFWYDVMSFYIGIEDELPPLPKPKFEVWKPSDNELCYYNDICGSVSNSRYLGGSPVYRIYQTKEQAIEAHEKAMFNYEVEMFIKEKNEGVVFDYADSNQAKHYLIYDYIQKKIYTSTSYMCKSVSDEKVFKSTEIGEEIIAKFDNDKLVKYWI